MTGAEVEVVLGFALEGMNYMIGEEEAVFVEAAVVEPEVVVVLALGLPQALLEVVVDNNDSAVGMVVVIVVVVEVAVVELVVVVMVFDLQVLSIDV